MTLMVPRQQGSSIGRRPCEFRKCGGLKDGLAGRPTSGVPTLPLPVPGAQWQAGVTIDNERYRVLLGGIPVPLAFAASARGGWVMVFLEPISQEAADGGKAHRIPREARDVEGAGGNAGFQTLRGDVRIVPGE